jgi:phosphate transport system substrate-binding protein
MKKYLLVLLILVSCSNNKSEKDFIANDTPKQGAINLSVDESFKPVIEEQIKVYHSSFPDAVINVSYKPEVECFKDLYQDSTRMIIVSRGLTKQENNYFKNYLSFEPKYMQVAYDAVAAIVNINNKDSVFTIEDLRKMMSGEKKYTIILDGNNATSTVKYLQDSVLKGKSFSSNVVAVKGSEAVIDAIKNTPNAIGFVGNSWVSNFYDEHQIQNLKKIKLALIECTKCEERGYFVKASQASLTYGQYPLARHLYFIVKENWLGLGSGFANFLSLERGQLIFKRSCLVPAKMNFNKRQGLIK